VGAIRAVAEAGRRSTGVSLEALLDQVAAGDRSAFDRLYELFQSRVYGLVVKVLIDRDQAQEVAQEVFLQLWQQASRFDGSKGSAMSWVMRIAHARAVDRVRICQASSLRDSRYAAAAHVADIDTVVEDVLLRAEQSALRAALLRLSALQLESIQLAYYCGMSTVEISAHLGVGRATVKTRIRDGLIKLAADLRSAAPEEFTRSGASAAYVACGR